MHKVWLKSNIAVATAVIRNNNGNAEIFNVTTNVWEALPSGGKPDSAHLIQAVAYTGAGSFANSKSVDIPDAAWVAGASFTALAVDATGNVGGTPADLLDLQAIDPPAEVKIVLSR